MLPFCEVSNRFLGRVICIATQPLDATSMSQKDSLTLLAQPACNLADASTATDIVASAGMELRTCRDMKKAFEGYCKNFLCHQLVQVTDCINICLFVTICRCIRRSLAAICTLTQQPVHGTCVFFLKLKFVTLFEQSQPQHPTRLKIQLECHRGS